MFMYCQFLIAEGFWTMMAVDYRQYRIANGIWIVVAINYRRCPVLWYSATFRPFAARVDLQGRCPIAGRRIDRPYTATL